MVNSMKKSIRNLVMSTAAVVVLAGGVLSGAVAASAADGTKNCGAVKFVWTFSYTPAGVSQPNSHRHENMGGSGDVTYTKWEGGNYTTTAGYHHDRYTLAGSGKSIYCED